MLTLRIWAISRKMLKFLKGFYVSLMSLHLTTFCFKQKTLNFLASHVMLTFRIRFYWDHAILNFSSLKWSWEQIKIKHEFCTQIYHKNCLAQIQGSKITFLDKKMFTSNIFSRLTNLLIVVRTKFILYKCLLSVINI